MKTNNTKINEIETFLREIKGKKPYEVSPSQTHRLYRLAEEYFEFLKMISKRLG